MTHENPSVDEFATRARAWLLANMPPADSSAGYFFFGEKSGG